jgi:hypothetical protein
MQIVTPLNDIDRFLAFWGHDGDKLHANPNCHTFSNGVLYGTIERGKEAGRTEGWCGICSNGVTDESFLSNGRLTTGITQPPASSVAPAPPASSSQAQSEATAVMVWIPQSGSRYHRTSSCSGMNNPSQVSIDVAKQRGFTACGRCY